MGPCDASSELETQVFEAIDLGDRLTTYGNFSYKVLHHILGFTYVDPEPIFLAEKIHRGKDMLESGDIRCENGKVISVQH